MSEYLFTKQKLIKSMDPYYTHSIKLKAERVRHLQKNRTKVTIKDLYGLMNSFLSLYHFGWFHCNQNTDKRRRPILHFILGGFLKEMSF